MWVVWQIFEKSTHSHPAQFGLRATGKWKSLWLKRFLKENSVQILSMTKARMFLWAYAETPSKHLLGAKFSVKWWSSMLGCSAVKHGWSRMCMLQDCMNHFVWQQKPVQIFQKSFNVIIFTRTLQYYPLVPNNFRQRSKRKSS